MIYTILWVLTTQPEADKWREYLDSPEDQLFIGAGAPLGGIGAKTIILLDWEPGTTNSYTQTAYERQWVDHALQCRLVADGTIIKAKTSDLK